MVQTTRITLRERIQNIEDAISAGQVDEAMEQCQQILSHYPDALEIQRLLGEVYLAQGRLDEAQQSFDWILVNDPENVIVYCDRALICEHQSDIDTALDCYQQAYELSRGNSQIRQEFNTLSAKVGQQEFMFSRAGLARLYMRGNLLTQAIQEWEAVLSVSPDRMDARLGLLETYWRDGLYDEVERMASSILEEVPHCLKALLLMAHVISAYNMQRARDLVARAEKLDPELLFAQDLFSDLMANQPNDPFLPLVRKEPITLRDGETNGKEKPVDGIGTSQYVAVEIEPVSPDEESSPNRVYNWSGMDSWSELDTRSVPQTKHAPEQSLPEEPSITLDTHGNGNGNSTVAHSPEEIIWSDDTNIEQVETWSSHAPAGQNVVADDFESWANHQEIDDDFDAALLEQQPWFQAEQSSGNAAEFVISEPDTIAEAPDNIPSWHSAPQREDSPTPPAWLDMLTQSGRKQPDEPVLPEPEPATSDPSPVTPSYAVEATQETHEAQEAFPSFFFSPTEKEEEEDMGWPDWLKSLGAESIEPEPAHTSASSPHAFWSEVEQPLEPQFEPQVQAYELEAETPIAQALPLEQAAETSPAEQEAWASPELTLVEAEAHYLTTLESLEQSLLSQGFKTLQPGSLSSIAQQAQEASLIESSPAEQPIAEDIVPTTITTLPEPEVAQQLPSPIVEEDKLLPEETALSKTPTAPLPVVEIEQAAPVHTAEQQIKQAAPTLAPEIVPQLQPQLQRELVPSAPLDLEAMLDNELETTMRRPAVRLQPMQAVAKVTDQSFAAGRSRPLDLTGQPADGKLSNKERLLKGYQFQLAGAYDDAMLEYRLLIRNAPELLGDVISNMRALLKLAPKYTAGYRVLGDAYMRQGEYLQAMESYNKALTIAKKAKSQSR